MAGRQSALKKHSHIRSLLESSYIVITNSHKQWSLFNITWYKFAEDKKTDVRWNCAHIKQRDSNSSMKFCLSNRLRQRDSNSTLHTILVHLVYSLIHLVHRSVISAKILTKSNFDGLRLTTKALKLRITDGLIINWLFDSWYLTPSHKSLVKLKLIAHSTHYSMLQENRAKMKLNELGLQK